MDEFNVIMLVLRVIAGPTIFLHGYNKMFRGGKIPGTAGWFDSIGMKPNGTIHAYMAAITEMGCGALILLGLLIVCCPLVIFAPLFMGENVEYCPDCGRKIA